MLEHFIPYSTQSIDESDKKSVIKALFSSHLTQGELVSTFEDLIAKFIGTKHAITFNSATSALYAAFYALKKSLNSQKTYSIITTPITFVATTNMMLAHNITPIFGDIDMSGKLKLEGLQNLVREDTIAICTMDYGGSSVDMSGFREFADRHNLIWISDSSHAFGGSVDNVKIGSMADMSIFSFHALKPITTCEGGAMVCSNDEYADSARLVCSHGIVKKALYNQDCVDLGFNFRLSEVAAALGISQLKRLDSFIDKREEIARFYDNAFLDNPYFSIIKLKDNERSTRHLYPILLHREYVCGKEALAQKLVEKNIGVQVHYKPIYNFSHYQRFNYPILRNAEDFYHAELSIPCHQSMNLNNAKIIADEILSVFG